MKPGYWSDKVWQEEMTSLGLKKDRAGTYQGRSASPDGAWSCPSAEGFTVLFYGGSHFRAGKPIPECRSFCCSWSWVHKPFDQGSASRHFWTVNSVWHFVTLRYSFYCLLFFASKYTWVDWNPSTHYYFLLCKENQDGMATVPDHYVWSSDVQKSVPKGFVVCLDWFVMAGPESASFFLKAKMVSLNSWMLLLLLFVFQILIRLPDGLCFKCHEQDQHSGIWPGIHWYCYKAVLVHLSFLKHGAMYIQAFLCWVQIGGGWGNTVKIESRQLCSVFLADPGRRGSTFILSPGLLSCSWRRPEVERRLLIRYLPATIKPCLSVGELWVLSYDQPAACPSLPPS